MMPDHRPFWLAKHTGKPNICVQYNPIMVGYNEPLSCRIKKRPVFLFNFLECTGLTGLLFPGNIS